MKRVFEQLIHDVDHANRAFEWLTDDAKDILLTQRGGLKPIKLRTALEYQSKHLLSVLNKLKDLPESKPEKNCGSCKNITSEGFPIISHGPCNECYEHGNWQPKSAEPQSWEQRLCEVCRKDLITPCRATAVDRNNCDRICLIRAEIERRVEEEKQKILTRIEDVRQSCYGRGALNPSPSTFIFSVMEDIKQNKHRSDK